MYISGQFLNFINYCLCYWLCPKPFYQFVIIYLAFYFPWCYFEVILMVSFFVAALMCGSSSSSKNSICHNFVQLQRIIFKGLKSLLLSNPYSRWLTIITSFILLRNHYWKDLQVATKCQLRSSQRPQV